MFNIALKFLWSYTENRLKSTCFKCPQNINEKNPNEMEQQWFWKHLLNQPIDLRQSHCSLSLSSYLAWFRFLILTSYLCLLSIIGQQSILCTITRHSVCCLSHILQWPDDYPPVIYQFDPPSSDWRWPHRRAYSCWKDIVPQDLQQFNLALEDVPMLWQDNESWRDQVVLVRSTSSWYEI